jgi:hypothetical protein
VDLDALTDGKTATGMPRRRRADDMTASGPIVLPPLSAPELSADFGAGDETWMPPSEVRSSGSLPSRHRGTTAAVPVQEPEPAPALGVEQRTSLFSSFRSLGDMDVAGPDSTLQLDAVSEDPAALPEQLSPAAPIAAPRAAEPSERHGHDEPPAFEALMADLPSRRSMRDVPSANRKRGLFGRRPGAGDDRTDEQPAWPDPVSGPVSAPASTPAPEPVRSSVLRSAAGAPQPTPAPYSPPPASVAPTGGGHGGSGTTYRGGVLPLRSPQPDPLADPLDLDYVPDTVEARSDWMASAVLYEEMSTLLRRGVFQEENVAPKNESETYRPLSVAASDAGGLTRRTRGNEPAGPADRFTARIERDPEQLRARLSAFQSATARGRDEAGDARGSTWTP